MYTVQLSQNIKNLYYVTKPEIYNILKGAIQVLRNAFFWKLKFISRLDPHPPPRNANNIEPYTCVTLFSGKFETPHPICIT